MAAQHSSGESEPQHRDIEQELVAECEALWQELQAVQQGVAGSGQALNSREPLTHIYRHKEKLLKAHIGLLKEHRLKSSVVQIDNIKGQVTTMVSQLDETLDMVKHKRVELRQDIQKAETLKDEQQQLQAALLERIRENEERAGSTSETAVEAEINVQISKYSNYYKKTVQELLAFVHTHYPDPNEDISEKIFNKSKNKSRAGANKSRTGGSNFMALSSMLEQIMNKSIDNAAEPYISLDPDLHWPPYVELLQRSGITVRHPHNENLIKITPFHL